MKILITIGFISLKRIVYLGIAKHAEFNENSIFSFNQDNADFHFQLPNDSDSVISESTEKEFVEQIHLD